MTTVEWRKIPGLPSKYEASSDGRIRILAHEVSVSYNLKTGVKVVQRHVPEREIKSFLSSTAKKRGKKIPCVSIGGSGETRVNLLVARAFHGMPYELGNSRAAQKWRVMHIDGDTTNVAADNLEWVGNAGGPNLTQNAAYDRAVQAWRQRCEEPVGDWLLRFYDADEIDWDETRWETVA